MDAENENNQKKKIQANMCFATSAQIINPKNQYRHRLDVMKC